MPLQFALSTWIERSASVTTRLKAMPLRVPESSSKAMARRGREKLFGKKLDANSAKRLTVTVLTAPFWVTQSYKRLRAFRLRRILGEAARWDQVPVCGCS